MKRYVFCLLIALSLAGCGRQNQAVDYGSKEPAAVNVSEAFSEPHADSFDLSESSLTAAAEALEGRLLYTNSTKIKVKASGEKPFECTIHLCWEGVDLMEFTLEPV